MRKLTSSYFDYIYSKAWGIVKDRIHLRDKVCQGCSQKNGLDVHHKSYKHFGKEFDEELVLICRKCHNLVHKRHKEQKTKKGKRKSLFLMTDLVLEELRYRMKPKSQKKTDEECRKCGGQLLERSKKLNNKRLKNAYHYCKYLQCSKCRALFMLEEYKTMPGQPCGCERAIGEKQTVPREEPKFHPDPKKRSYLIDV